MNPNDPKPVPKTIKIQIPPLQPPITNNNAISSQHPPTPFVQQSSPVTNKYTISQGQQTVTSKQTYGSQQKMALLHGQQIISPQQTYTQPISPSQSTYNQQTIGSQQGYNVSLSPNISNKINMAQPISPAARAIFPTTIRSTTETASPNAGNTKMRSVLASNPITTKRVDRQIQIKKYQDHRLGPGIQKGLQGGGEKYQDHRWARSTNQVLPPGAGEGSKYHDQRLGPGISHMTENMESTEE